MPRVLIHPFSAANARSLLTLAITALIFVHAARGVAQEASNGGAAEAAKPQPITTSDPEIPLDQLELLLKPLTQAELVTEVEGWQALLRAKAMQISRAQIALLQEKQAANSGQPTANAETAPAQTDDAAQTDDQAAAAAEEADENANSLLNLQEQRAHLADRADAAITALEKKGGEVDIYRQYVSATTGVDFQVSDASTTWALIRGWLTSEQGGLRWMWNLIKFVVILLAFYFGAGFLANLTRRAVARFKGVSQLLVSFAGTFVKQLMMVIGFIVALSALEVNIGPLMAAVGAAGFVVGLALQGTLSNFASGLLILLYRPFDVGDVIDGGGVSGIVDSVTLFSTHVRTFDNKLMIVPNNDIWGGTITNATASTTRRVDMVFGIGYSDDADLAKSILESIVKQHPLVLAEPVPVIELNELGDSSVNFICRPWAKTSDYWKVYWEVTKSVKQAFDQQGISIPFPQRDVHIYQHD